MGVLYGFLVKFLLSSCKATAFAWVSYKGSDQDLQGSARGWSLNGEAAGSARIAVRVLGDFGNVNGEQLDERGVISDGNLNMRLVVEF